MKTKSPNKLFIYFVLISFLYLIVDSVFFSSGKREKLRADYVSSSFRGVYSGYHGGKDPIHHIDTFEIYIPASYAIVYTPNEVKEFVNVNSIFEVGDYVEKITNDTIIQVIRKLDTIDIKPRLIQ